MPEVEVEGGRLYYMMEGPPGAPVVLLSNALGTTTDMWAAQALELARSFRVLRYDTRGHGSWAPSGGVDGPAYTLDQLGRDAVAVLDAARVERAHVCGLSLGGLTGMWLGLSAPERVATLVLANTGARVGSAELWDRRIQGVRANGMEFIADSVIPRWFTAAFRERRPDVVEHYRSMVARCPAVGYTGCCFALRDADLRDSVARIAAATLVIVGTSDPSTPPSLGEFVAGTIPGAQLAVLDSAHMSNVERADEFTSLVLDFLCVRS